MIVATDGIQHEQEVLTENTVESSWYNELWKVVEPDKEWNYDRFAIWPLPNEGFLIVARENENSGIGLIMTFASGLNALKMQGYTVVMRLPSGNLPSNVLAVWATKTPK